MTIRLHRGDLPTDLARYTGSAAIDTETMGLNPHRDRLCVVQISPGDGSADVIQIAHGQHRRAEPEDASRRSRTSSRSFTSRASISPRSTNAFGVMPQPVYCTKIASRLTRTYTDRHGLKDLVREAAQHRSVEAAAVERLGAQTLSDAQLAYAASDVLHLHALREQARCHAGARRPHRAGAGVFRVPADAGAARSLRLGGRGYFRAFVSAAWPGR